MQNHILETKEIEISLIIPNPKNPRKNLEDVESLKASIDEIGLIQPINVQEMKNGKHEIEVGGRRFKAVTELGWKKITCNVVRSGDSYNAMLAENLVRKNLNPIEEAEAIDYIFVKRYGKNYLMVLNSPMKTDKKEAMFKDFKSFNVTVARAKNLAQILFLDEDIKDKIRKKYIGLTEAVSLINVKDVSERKEIAEGLTSGIPYIKKRAKEELNIKLNKETSVGYALKRIQNNLAYVKNSIEYMDKNLQDINGNGILEQHKNIIEEIKKDFTSNRIYFKALEVKFNERIKTQKSSKSFSQKVEEISSEEKISSILDDEADDIEPPERP